MLAARAIVTSFGLTAWLAAAAVHAAPAPVLWEPDPDGESTGYVEDATWADEGPGYRIRLRLVDEAERLAYLERTTGHRIDPFATPPDREPRYLSFLLELANTGGSTLELRSESAWLRAASEVLNPIGIEGLASAARTVGADVGEAYQRARPAVLESSVVVGAGDTVSGLLVYRRLESGAKRFRVEIHFTLPNGELARFVAHYRRAKPAREAKGDAPSNEKRP